MRHCNVIYSPSEYWFLVWEFFTLVILVKSVALHEPQWSRICCCAFASVELLLALWLPLCLTGWLSDLSESGAGLSWSAWIFLAWRRSLGAWMLSGGRRDNWWDLLLTNDFVREGRIAEGVSEKATSAIWHLQYISMSVPNCIRLRKSHYSTVKTRRHRVFNMLIYENMNN